MGSPDTMRPFSVGPRRRGRRLSGPCASIRAIDDTVSGFALADLPSCCELWTNLGPVGDRAVTYEDLLPPLRARGFAALCEVLEKKVKAYRGGDGYRNPDLPQNG
jgi:hypothetical protein